MTTRFGRPEVLAARRSVLVVFALSGVVFATWASRIADLKATLDLSAGDLGITLLAGSIGALFGLPLAGRVAARFGTARTVLGGGLASTLGILLIAVAVDQVGSRATAAAGLYLVGAGIGVWDVAMNLEGAAVERALGRSVMPHFHAAFSGGTVVAALLGAAASWAQVPLLLHFAAVVVLTSGFGWWALRFFLPDRQATAPGNADAAEPGGQHRSAWREPRTLLVGVVVFAAALTEGTATDWLAVAFVEGHEFPSWAGILGFATFLLLMTVGRLLGTGLLDRYGRVPVLRVSFGLAAVGVLLVVAGSGAVAFVGAAVWGVGVALGFPVGMSASADDPARAAARISVVATLGYAAFVAGPPVLGFLGDRVGVLRSLLLVGALALLALGVVTAVREPSRQVRSPVST
jgi:fucose permease